MILLAAVIFACWGSFLNMVAYRLIHEVNFLISRSFCPQCKSIIAWYDLIPIFSWLYLQGKCRYCKKNISFLYLLIELITIASLMLLWFEQLPATQFFSYAFFFSALIITIRSDFETMLISPIVTSFLVPIGLLLSYNEILKISLYESILGTLFGFFILQIINLIYKVIKKQDGIGDGDHILLAFIGSFTGIIGCWGAILTGSILGTFFISAIFFIKKPKNIGTVKLAFGSFLALGSIIFVLYQELYLLLLF